MLNSILYNLSYAYCYGNKTKIDTGSFQISNIKCNEIIFSQ